MNAPPHNVYAVSIIWKNANALHSAVLRPVPAPALIPDKWANIEPSVTQEVTPSCGCTLKWFRGGIIAIFSLFNHQLGIFSPLPQYLRIELCSIHPPYHPTRTSRSSQTSRRSPRAMISRLSRTAEGNLIAYAIIQAPSSRTDSSGEDSLDLQFGICKARMMRASCRLVHLDDRAVISTQIVSRDVLPRSILGLLCSDPGIAPAYIPDR